MTSTIDRAEINRRNAQKSTGPRTPEGKARSRFNAVKHGCRARLPILPGEDPEAYERRLDAWVGKFAPARRGRALPGGARRPRLLAARPRRPRRGRPTRGRDRGRCGAAGRGCREAGRGVVPRPRRPTSWRTRRGWRSPTGRSSPGRSTRSIPSTPPDWSPSLEATAIGCDWLLARWAELGQILDEGRHWRPTDRLRAIRLLGKQPLDVVADDQLLAIYLACHAMDPDGPDVFAEPLGDLRRPEMQASRERLSARFAAARAERSPRDAAEGRATLRAIVTAAVARVEALREVRAAAEAVGAADISARLSYYGRETVEWLRKHQVTCSRALFRTFDELRKVRREFGDDLPADEPAPAPGPAADEADETPAPLPCGVVEPEVPRPTGPVAVERVADHDPTTNEASHAGASDGSASDGYRSPVAAAETVTNEASEQSGEVEGAPADPISQVPASRPVDDGVGRSGLSHQEYAQKGCEESPVGCSMSTAPARACASAPCHRLTTDPEAFLRTAAVAWSRLTFEPRESLATDPSGRTDLAARPGDGLSSG